MKIKKLFSMHVDLDAFIPATDDEKSYMVQMREPSTFWKDGLKRLKKNKVAMVSFFVIVVITLACIIIPWVWPYSYDDMLGVKFGQSADGTYSNLNPFEYGETELADIETYNLWKQWKKDGKVMNATEYAAYVKEGWDAFENYTTEEIQSWRDTIAALGDLDDSDSNKTRKSMNKKLDAARRTFLKTNDYDEGYLTFDQYQSAVEDWEAGEEPENVFPHILGTDGSGRDYFIRIIYGTRISLLVGFFASLIVLVIGLLVGSIAGYFGGKVDLVIMRIVDIIYSLPDMLMIILLAAVLRRSGLSEAIEGTILESIGSNIISLFIVFALLYWVSMSRLVRGQILALREQEYVLASKASGAQSKWIIRKHLLPNCISVIIISTALQIPSAIFTESYLSFLGLGVNAPMPSLGSLASEALNGYISYPLLLLFPALMISLIVLSLNLFGDGLRDAFDPKLKN